MLFVSALVVLVLAPPAVLAQSNPYSNDNSIGTAFAPVGFLSSSIARVSFCWVHTRACTIFPVCIAIPGVTVGPLLTPHMMLGPFGFCFDYYRLLREARA